MLLLPVVAAGQGFRTTLKGTVNGRPQPTSDGQKQESKSISVFFAEDDWGGVPRYIIPIVDGKFEQVIEGDAIRMMKIMFSEDAEYGGGRFLEFFPDAEVVEVVFGKSSKVKGGELNKRLIQFKKDAGKEAKAEYVPVPELKALGKKMRAFGNNMRLNDPEVQPIFARITEIRDSLSQINYDVLYRILDRENDLVPYSFFIDHLHYQNYPSDLDLLTRVQAKFAAAHPGHPYNELAADMVGAKMMTRFVDFTAPDIDGVMHTLSEEIEGKVALIDLWASWCGPCIMHSRTVVPVYNEYKDRGFTVVGIMRESRNTDAMKVALEREKFPWLNMVDLDDKLNIWNKYGLSNAAGGTVLVDSEGNVVKKDPTAEEIREYLKKNLK